MSSKMKIAWERDGDYDKFVRFCPVQDIGPGFAIDVDVDDTGDIRPDAVLGGLAAILAEGIEVDQEALKYEDS